MKFKVGDKVRVINKSNRSVHSYEYFLDYMHSTKDTIFTIAHIYYTEVGNPFTIWGIYSHNKNITVKFEGVYLDNPIVKRFGWSFKESDLEFVEKVRVEKQLQLFE